MPRELRHSYSSLNLFHTCPRAWAYRFVAEYERLGWEGTLHMLRGTAFHGMIQADLIQRGAKMGTLLEKPTDIEIVPGVRLALDWSTETSPTIATVDLVTEIELSPLAVLGHIREWEAGVDEKMANAMIDLYEDTLSNRLHDLWFRYLTHYSERMNNYVPLLTEYEWARIAPNGETLQGRLDSVGFNVELGLIEVRDAKTNESWPQAATEITELFNSQLHLQAWGVAPFLRESGGFLESRFGLTDVRPSVVSYDRVRWSMPRTPVLTKQGKLSKAVKDFSPENYKAFFETPEAHEAGVLFDEGVYNVLSEHGVWFRRTSAPVNINVISTHIYGLQDQAARANTTTLENALLIPSDHCGWCEFRHLCEQELRGGRFELDERELAEYHLRKRTT